jgi:ribosomal protein L11 methyltransferase
MLAGLLEGQAEAVASAYRRQGLMLSWRVTHGEWPTLVMRKRKALGWR